MVRFRCKRDKDASTYNFAFAIQLGPVDPLSIRVVHPPDSFGLVFAIGSRIDLASGRGELSSLALREKTKLVKQKGIPSHPSPICCSFSGFLPSSKQDDFRREF